MGLFGCSSGGFSTWPDIFSQPVAILGSQNGTYTVKLKNEQGAVKCMYIPTHIHHMSVWMQVHL